MSELYMYMAIFILIILLIVLFFWLKRPEYKKFKSMSFYGVTWKWKWKQNSIISLCPYCPTCKEELWYDDEHSKATTNLNEKFTFLICQKCDGDQKGRIQGGDRNYSLNLVKREIFRRINSQEYKKDIE